MTVSSILPTPIKALLLFFSLSLVSGSLTAQNQFNISDLEAGQIVLNLSANEQTSVEQDTLNANLSYTVQGKDRSALQNEVNQVMTEALALLADTQDIDYSTLQYQVYIFQTGRSSRNDIENPVWRAQQGIRLTSLETEKILDIVGNLQALGLTISSLNFSLSSQKYEEVTDSLMKAALDKLQNRADEAARALNKSSANLVEVSINGNGNNNYVFEAAYRAGLSTADSDQMTRPVAAPQDTQVSLNVSARAILSP